LGPTPMCLVVVPLLYVVSVLIISPKNKMMKERGGSIFLLASFFFLASCSFLLYERDLFSFVFSFFPFILPFVFFHLHAHTQGKENKGLEGETYGVRKRRRDSEMFFSFSFSLLYFCSK
jgi:preprotein translocase subunit YajC